MPPVEEQVGVDDWGTLFDGQPEHRRRFIASMFIETKRPGEVVHFNRPTRMQMEAQPAYEDPTVQTQADVKSRQIGRSTQDDANTWYDANASDGPHRTLIATDHSDTTRSHMRRFQTFYDNSPPGLQAYSPVRFNLSLGELHCERNGSLIALRTMGGKSAARSHTFHLLVLDEVGYWPNAEENYASVRATLDDDLPERWISTPNGPGNLYHRTVLDLQERIAVGDKTCRLNFWPWYLHPGYRKTPPTDWEPTSEDVTYGYLHGLDPTTEEGRARLYWRRDRIRRISLARFRQHYPSTIEEGFMVWAGGWFDLEHLNNLLAKYEPFERDHAGEVRIYEPPQKGMDYAIGVDPSLCSSDEDTSDWAVAHVLDRRGRTAAVMSAKRGGIARFARRVSRLSGSYNKARVMCERNPQGGGNVVIQYLENEGVPLWKDVTGRVPRDWTTGHSNRLVLLDHFREQVDSDALDVRDVPTLREMLHFRDERGKLQGQDGVHDDHVFAFALAEWNRRSLPTATDGLRSADRYGTQRTEPVWNNPHQEASRAWRKL